jgi:hypothetical protein
MFLFDIWNCPFAADAEAENIYDTNKHYSIYGGYCIGEQGFIAEKK